MTNSANNVFFSMSEIGEGIKTTFIAEDDGGDLFDTDATVMIERNGVEVRFDFTLGEVLELSNALLEAGSAAYAKFGGQ